jgi:hypothetical protein
MLPRRDRDSQRAAPTDLALLYAIHLDNDRERATAQPKSTPNFKQRLRGGGNHPVRLSMPAPSLGA